MLSPPREQDDLVLQIFGCMDVRMLWCFLLTSRRYNRIASEDVLWRALLLAALGGDESYMPCAPSPATGGWRRRFWQWHRLDGCSCALVPGGPPPAPTAPAAAAPEGGAAAVAMPSIAAGAGAAAAPPAQPLDAPIAPPDPAAAAPGVGGVGGGASADHAAVAAAAEAAMAAPTARFLHRSACLSGRWLYVFGGRGASSEFNDLWVLDKAAAASPTGSQRPWQFVSTAEAPPQRQSATLTAVGRSLVMFGGRRGDSTFLNDTWLFSMDDATWQVVDDRAPPPPPPPPPPPLDAAAVVAANAVANDVPLVAAVAAANAAAANAAAAFAAANAAAANAAADAAAANAAAANMAMPGAANAVMPGAANVLPPALQAVAAAAQANQAVGANALANALEANGNGNGNALAAVLARPSPRWAHSAVAFGARVLVFGGSAPGKCFGDLHWFDRETTTWRRQPNAGGPQPAARSGHCACALGGSMYVFGGNTTKHSFNDLWEFATACGVWRHIRSFAGEPPSGRVGHTLTPVGSRLLVLGGREYQSNRFDGRLHSFNVTSRRWSRVAISQAATGAASGAAADDDADGRAAAAKLSVRTGHCATVHAGRLLLFGGLNDENQLLSDLTSVCLFE